MKIVKKATACECSAPGWCERHKMAKPRLFWLACQRNKELYDLWEQGASLGVMDSVPPLPLPRCQHRGTDILDQQPCELCGNRSVLVPIFDCSVHGRCSERRFGNRSEVSRAMPACTTCRDYLAVGDSTPLQ